MRKSLALALGMIAVGCATGGRTIEEDDAGVVKDSSPADTRPQDTYQPPEDTGAPDNFVPMDSGTCAQCDLADSMACMGSVCGWDPMMMTSKCGYTLGTGMQGATCGMNTPCAQGYVCVSPANKCLHWCKMPNGTCPQATTCSVMLQMPPMVCGVAYAACQ
jgi:hypothetical protein